MMVLKGPNEIPRKDPEIGILISLLEINSNSTIKFKRAISFCFKISKQTKSIENFKLSFTQ